MRDSRWLASFFALCGLLLIGGPAQAAFHLMKVVEVFPGTAAAPGAQYVVLQMYAVGQTVVSGHSIIISDASGTPVVNFPFTGNVANGANQAKILIATTEAATFFGVSANLTMTASLPLAGGKVCFDAIDCVAWGNYAPPGTDATVGTPFNSDASPVAAQPERGLVSSKAIARRLDIAGVPTALESSDDTNNSANDFRIATPAPRNNAGQTGTVPAATCGNTVIEGLEDCDDGGILSGDGCSATCVDEFCGDLATNDVDEGCDDGNATSGDGCDANCTVTGCGNGIVTAGETCELPNQGVCGPTCIPTTEFPPVDWITPTGGTAGARAATLQSIGGPQISSADLSGANYSAAPLSASVETVDYDTSSNWSFAVSQPAQSILLYTVNWRGGEGGVDPVTYDFDSPFMILSGLEGATVENDDKRLVLAADAFYSGILQFVGPISSVAVDVNSISTSPQTMTFAVVPEPADAAAAALAALAVLKLCTQRRRRGRLAC